MARRGGAAFLILLALVALASSAPTVATTPAAERAATGGATQRVSTALRPLPECRYVDVMSRYRGLQAWRRTLLDTNLRVGKGYRPRDLVSVSRAGIGGAGRVRSLVIADLSDMAAAARAAHSGIAVRSAYRSYGQQVATFNGWVAREGYRQALLFSARPGHSEHQLGTTVDFRSSASSLPGWDYADWATTPSGRWMKKHAWRYGFVMSYPRGKTAETCYGYEPWHYRYLGRERARAVHDSGLTLRRYLWRHFETAP